MFTKSLFKRNKLSGYRAQAMVEFAIALPILLALLVGILEVGRMVFIYSAVTNASREAVRYASAIGREDVNGYEKYRYCEGIRSIAKRSAYFMNLADADITIAYDHGPTSVSPFDECPVGVTVDNSIEVNSGTDADRVVVTVSATYNPMINLIPISSRPITSSSARTILGIYDLDGDSATSTSAPSGPSATFTATVPTSTSTPAPTNTPTATSTFSPGPVITLTTLPTNTPTLVPSFTPTGTLIATSTFTPTSLFTPTITSTSVTGCSSVTTSTISVPGNTTMSMTITNPNTYSITVSNVQVTWNHDLGHKTGSDKTLKLVSASLGGMFWSGNAVGPSATLTPSTTLTIPASATSTIVFTFHQTYDSDRTDGTESIVINLSTPGCESTPIHRP